MYTAKVAIKASDPNEPRAHYKNKVLNGVFYRAPESNLSADGVKRTIEKNMRNALEGKNKGLILGIRVSVCKIPQSFIMKEGDDEIWQ